MQIETVEYRGWKECLRLSNRDVDLVITTQVGPRVIRFGFIGEDNEFGEFLTEAGMTGGDQFRLYGGHRLWASPEANPRSYYPDNFPVQVEKLKDRVRLTAPLETTTGIQKTMEISLDDNAPRVHVTHRLRNGGLWPVPLAVWGLSMVNLGGVAIVPLPPRGSWESGDLLPSSILSLWPFTDMADPRFTWGKRFIMLRQDASKSLPQKVGASVPDGWIAYARAGHLFLKQFPYHAGENYPDFGCNAETYTRNDMAELESLGPMTLLEPGQSVEHVETWNLLRDIPQPQTEADIEKNILPRLKTIIT